MNTRKRKARPILHRFIIIALMSMMGVVSAHAQVAQQTRLVLEENNEFGGQTYEYRDSDDSMIREFFDDDDILIKEERVFTSEYPIDNGLRKIITHYAFEKKIKEEKIFSRRVSQITLIERSIDHFDRTTGLKTKSENHFIDAYPGHNVIFRENGRKTRIEWYYPKNLNGIVKHVVFFDEKEKAAKVESLYSKKTIQEEGYYRRVYYNEYSPNKYFRKSMEEVYYSDEHALNNEGVIKVIKHYHYRPGKLFATEVHLFDRYGDKLLLDDETVARYERHN